MEEKISLIKDWLGTGSINIFGLPMSGKDTQGIKLAEALDGKFLSSGLIIRAMEKETKQYYSKDGELIPTDVFYEWVLPFFKRPDLADYPLILSSIGRWHGEEEKVIEAASDANHDIKAALILNVSESDVETRYEKSKTLQDRGTRQDDKDIAIFKTRIQEFREKTAPVLQYYLSQGLAIEINGVQTREAVFNEIVEKLADKASRSRS